MPNQKQKEPDGEGKEEILFTIYADLIEKELQKAFEDLKEIRANESQKTAAKDSCMLLRATLANTRHYLRELEYSLE